MRRRDHARITRFRSFTRYAAPPPAPWAGSRWALLLAFLLSPSTAHALGVWLGR